MQEHEELNPAQRELEKALGSLKAAPPQIDRDAVMYRAGLVVGRRSCRRYATAATLVAAALGVTLAAMHASQPKVVERIVYVPEDAGAPTAARTVEPWPMPDSTPDYGRGEYLRLRQEVLAKGLSALPASSHGGGTNEQYQRLRMRLLPRPAADSPPTGFSKFWSLFASGDES